MQSVLDRAVDDVRLLVTWQSPEVRAFWRIGVLSHSEADGYEFEYVSGVANVAGFVPFAGLQDLSRVYKSATLFPVFAERSMDPRRRGFEEWLRQLHVDSSASPMEILSRSHGTKGSDTVQLFAVPEVQPDRSTTFQFFVHGVRHVPGASERVESLRPGQELEIQEHPENTWDARALIVAKDGGKIGYIPGPLLELVHALRADGACSLKVVQVNPESMGSHFRVLVESSGRVPEDFDVLASMKAATL